MIKLVDRTLELLFKCVQRLKEKHEHSERTTDNLNREMEIFKKNQVENLELEDTTCKMKLSQDRFNTAGKTPWRQGTETIQTEAESRVEKKVDRASGSCGTDQAISMYNWIIREKMYRLEQRNIFKNTSQIFPNWVKDRT